MEECGVRVATLNLWGQNGAWEQRQSVLIDGLRRLPPDLIAFQEAIVGDGYDQVCVLYPVCVDASSRKRRFKC
jgi:hypothetical protein